MDNGIPLWLPFLAIALLLLLFAGAAAWMWHLYDRASRSERELRDLAQLFVAAYQPPERRVPQEGLTYILRKTQARCPIFTAHLGPILDEDA